MKKPLFALCTLALITALTFAGCGDSDSSNSGGGYGPSRESTTKPAASEAPEDASAAIVSTASVPSLGKVIVNAKGFTLYDFHKDKGGKPSCYGACTEVWPPLLTSGKPQVSEGAMASKLGTAKRKDGTLQVTYAGWPLYTYEADAKPGDATGNDIDSFGAEWYALQPSGEEAEG